jgi:hypothetical protein
MPRATARVTDLTPREPPSMKQLRTTYVGPVLRRQGRLGSAPFVVLAALLTGCVTTNWRHPGIDDPAAESRQRQIDDGYCQRVVAGSAPMPTLYIPPTVGSQTFSGSVNAYNPGTGYTQSTFTGTATPSPAASFTGGFAQGLAMGAAIKASNQRRAIHTSCMLSLGWADGEDEANRLRAARTAYESNSLAAVRAAIDATPELVYWRDHDPERWAAALSADEYARKRPENANLTYLQRFRIVVEMVKLKYPEKHQKTPPR